MGRGRDSDVASTVSRHFLPFSPRRSYCMCVGSRACTPRLTATLPRPCCRRVPCKFERIGCPWEGPPHELKEHEQMCTHPSKPAADIMDLLDVTYHRQEDEMRLYKNIFNLLSLEKITFSGESICLFSSCSS